MRTITVDDNYHWKDLQLHGDEWICIVCDARHATNRVTWQDHRDTVIFQLRYCSSCLPQILTEPPLDLQIKLPRPSEWQAKLSSSEEPCDVCGSPVDFWDGLTGQYVLCPAHRNRWGRFAAFRHRIMRTSDQ